METTINATNHGISPLNRSVKEQDVNIDEWYEYEYIRSLTKRVAVRASRIHRFGLFALEDTVAGCFIVEYSGERISAEEADRREKLLIAEGKENNYMLKLTGGIHLDATEKGNEGRYANHSCCPNAELVTVPLGSKQVVEVGFLCAKRTINVGQEETVPYSWSRSCRDGDICQCGAHSCKRRM